MLNPVTMAVLLFKKNIDKFEQFDLYTAINSSAERLQVTVYGFKINLHVTYLDQGLNCQKVSRNHLFYNDLSR